MLAKVPGVMIGVDERDAWFGDKQIVMRDDIDKVLLNLWKQPSVMGGRDKLYEEVKKKYIGISRRRCMAFLRNLEAYQLTQPLPKQTTLRPIVAKKPNNIWQVDLCDMGSKSPHFNSGYRYIIVMIDLFSKYVWAVPVKDKTALEVVTEIGKVLDSVDGLPSAIQSDQGSEFKNELMTDTLKDLHITQIFSKTYTPQSQGQVERFNLTLKKRLLLYMTQNNTSRWVDALPEVIRGYNESKHSSTGYAPIDLLHAEGDDVVKAHDKLKQKATN